MWTKFRWWLARLICSHTTSIVDHIGDYPVSTYLPAGSTGYFICKNCQKVIYAADLRDVDKQTADTVRLLYGD